MINLGLSHEDMQKFEQGLLDDHEIRITTRVLTMEHKAVGELTDHVLDGQVDVDVTQTVRRSASVTLLDPQNTLGIDTDTPSGAGAMANRMLQIFYGVRSQQLPRWVDVPVFTGPITGTDRDGATVTMTAHSKEALLLDAFGQNRTYVKGTPKTAVLTDMLQRTGEVRYALTPRPDKLTANFSLASSEAVWTKAVGLSRGITGGFIIDYDGRGTAVLKDTTTPVLWTFRGGDGGSLLGQPKYTADTSSIKNQVVVTGGIPAGSKKRITAVANAQAAHPFSAKNLGRNGYPRYLRETIDEDSITVRAAAQTLANNKLWELLQAGTDATWDSLVIPHLEPWDYVRVVGDHYTFETAAVKFSIPLTDEGRMTHGKHWNRRRVNGFSPTRAKNPRIPAPKKKTKPAPKPKKSSTRTKHTTHTRKGTKK